VRSTTASPYQATAYSLGIPSTFWRCWYPPGAASSSTFMSVTGAPGKIGNLSGGRYVKICREVASFLHKNYVAAETGYIGICKASNTLEVTRQAKDIRDISRRSSRAWYEATQFPGGVTGPVSVQVIDPAPPTFTTWDPAPPFKLGG
jgi:hypothetical protein